MKKIGIVSAFDPHKDKKAHSGILFKINESIEKADFETVWVRNPVPFSFKLFAKIVTGLKLLGMKKGVYLNHTKLGAKLLASTIDYKAARNCDYLVVLHHNFVPAYFKTSVPIIYHSDSTFDLANDYYLHNLPKWHIRQGNYIEQKALDNCAYHLSSSDWRNNSIKEKYSQKSNKCFVLEYGPCVEDVNLNYHYRHNSELRIFFSGVAWSRKGGEIAVDTVRLLNERGIKAKLIIAGISKKPDSCVNNEAIEWIGFLDKNKKEDYERLMTIYSTSDLFLLPTKAECAGIVFCEASLMGLPILTYDTGGIPNYVRNGINGYRMSEKASSDDFATKIEDMVRNGEFDKLSVGARCMYEQKLNWDNWTEWFKNNLR